MKFCALVVFALLTATDLFAADRIPDFGDFPLLDDFQALRMEPPFESRYYITFKTKSAGPVSVAYDLFYKGKPNEQKNRVIIQIKGQEDYVVPPSEYGKLYRQLPKSLYLDSGGSVGITLQDCVRIYKEFLSHLKN